MNHPLQQIDFASVLASCVHDMKNSLFMLLQSIEQLAEGENLPEQHQHELAKLHYEAYRVNTNLMQLLGLYRIEKKRLPLQIEEYFVIDLFEELIAKNTLYLTNRNIEIQSHVDEDLAWYFDNDLINNLLTDVVNNALRYCKKNIILSARLTLDDELEIEIHDDGEGYPQQMLNFSLDQTMEFDMKGGRTGLGLYFASLIANSHKNKNRHGRIALCNGGQLGGSVFTLTLP